MKIISKIIKNMSSYIKDNIKTYILVLLIFVIGIFIGVMLINNYNEDNLNKLKTYITEFITKIKNIENLDKKSLIIESSKNNMILGLVLWGAGTTVIGMPIVLIIILAEGLTLGYTIATISYTLGNFKGVLFCISTLVLKNILFIPAILTIGVSSIKLYKSIIKDRQKEKIKVNICKHTAISGIMIIILIFSSVIENTLSITLLEKILKFF